MGKKKVMITLAIVSTVLSLIYIVFSYYGINRYLGMYLFPIKSYSKEFTKLDKASDKRVVINLLNGRKGEITVKSLLDQTVRVDEIAINCKYRDKIRDELRNVCMDYYYSLPYNDVGNLIPPLLREGEEDTIIILVRNNIIYGKDFIETMIENTNIYKDSILYCGSSLSEWKSVLFYPSMFSEEIIDWNGKSLCGPWLERYVKKNKIRNIKIEYKGNFKIL